MDYQHIVFLVWDACRSDTVAEHADTFQTLAADNLSFERAFAPSFWTVPSHASLFTGEYPSEHRTCTKHGATFSDLPLVSELTDSGYRTYGVSANPYLSPQFDCDASFDEFLFTMRSGLTRGADIPALAAASSERGVTGISKWIDVGTTALASSPLAPTLYNLTWAGVRKALSGFDSMESRHPWFKIAYAYSGAWNTDAIRRYVTGHDTDDHPMFCFANYMDTHSPYYPREQFSAVSELFRYPGMYEVNERIGRPFEFMTELATSGVDEAELETLRSWYTGEVETLDDHLGRLLSLLETEGMREDTLVVVTADHGEDLGEVGPRGERRMGHTESVSDALLTVPLVIAHPDIESRTVSHPVETRRLPSVFTGDRTSTDDIVATLRPPNDTAVVECAASMAIESVDDYPSVPAEYLRKLAFEHTVVADNGSWKVAALTDGSRHAWHDGERASFDDAPADVTERCQSHLDRLKERVPRRPTDSTTDIDDDVSDRLEDLGYV
jgi:hypothetical protein